MISSLTANLNCRVCYSPLSNYQLSEALNKTLVNNFKKSKSKPVFRLSRKDRFHKENRRKPNLLQDNISLFNYILSVFFLYSNLECQNGTGSRALSTVIFKKLNLYYTHICSNYLCNNHRFKKLFGEGC